MPRIFWSMKRKKRLIEQSKTMTLAQMAKAHFRQPDEIEKMLKQLSPDNPLIKRIYYEGKVKVTVYYPGYADGVKSQLFHRNRSFY